MWTDKKHKGKIDQINSFLFGLDVGENECKSIYIAPDVETSEKLIFFMNAD